jgi:hypothetical protein
MDTLVDPVWKAAMETDSTAADTVPGIEDLADDFPELKIIEMIARLI